MPAQTFKATIVQGFKTWALPRLAELPDAKWDEAIQKAQDTEFDGVERIALIAGLVAVTYLLRIESGAVPAISLPVIYLVQFVEAVLLLILLDGPFYLRRARRGLDLFIAAYDKEKGCNRNGQ
jgi:hypothetical protein